MLYSAGRARAFCAPSAELAAKAGRLLDRDVSAYEKLHGNIAAAFRKAFPEYKTQTEHVLAVHFGSAESPQKNRRRPGGYGKGGRRHSA